MRTHRPSIAPILITAFLLTAALCCLAAILMSGHKESAYVADVYQDGVLILSISLKQEHSAEHQETSALRTSAMEGSSSQDSQDLAMTGSSSQLFLIEGKNHCYNQIEVRDGAIGITDASCPDKLCVHQGFLDSPGIPITCLPNRLVIQIRKADPDLADELTGSTDPDIVAY